MYIIKSKDPKIDPLGNPCYCSPVGEEIWSWFDFHVLFSVLRCDLNEFAAVS
jgi:hypothetical protein